MFCHKCGSLLSNEAKFCPSCGEKVFADFVELIVTSTGVDNEIFSNMKFDIFVDGIQIGSMPGKGTISYQITSGQHRIKIGAAVICVNVSGEEGSVTLDFIWGLGIEQRIVCHQSQVVVKTFESEEAVSQVASNKKLKMRVLAIASFAAVFVVIVVTAIIINLDSVDDVSLVTDNRNKDPNDSSLDMIVDVAEQDSIAKDDREVRKAYAEKVKELAKQDSTILFDLIDLDGNDVLELVADHQGYDVSVFTWADGKIITLMNEWIYGVGGNVGYGYLPGRNIIYNYNMDQCGAIIYESYWAVNKYYEVASLSGETLKICYFNDANRNEMIDEGEEISEEPFYYYGNIEITEEEYTSYQFHGDYDWISGDKNSEEILRELNVEN